MYAYYWDIDFLDQSGRERPLWDRLLTRFMYLRAALDKGY